MSPAIGPIPKWRCWPAAAAIHWPWPCAPLPAEDQVIVSMRIVDGLTLNEIKRALHLDVLTADRLAGILSSLRAALESQPGTRA